MSSQRNNLPHYIGPYLFISEDLLDEPNPLKQKTNFTDYTIYFKLYSCRFIFPHIKSRREFAL